MPATVAFCSSNAPSLFLPWDVVLTAASAWNALPLHLLTWFHSNISSPMKASLTTYLMQILPLEFPLLFHPLSLPILHFSQSGHFAWELLPLPSRIDIL